MADFKTPFMWAGSKDKNWNDISKYIPKKYDAYVEPFVGGGAVYFRVLNNSIDRQCRIADINKDLIYTYEVIRDDVEYIISNLPSEKDKDIFKRYMKKDVACSKSENAMRFLYLNRNRFFGMGGWMVADRYARKSVISRLRHYSPRMKNTVAYNDAFEVPIGKDDFVFCDPPYPETNNGACYKIDDDHILKLNLDYLKKVSDSGAKFLFITKNVQEVQCAAKKMKLDFDVKKWTFRKPQKDPVISEEIWIHRTEKKNNDFLDFS